ncbi:MAG: GNAT family protein [Oscillospiraceae bacterium]
MNNIWQSKSIKLRSVEESDCDGYFSQPQGVLSQKLYDELTFPENSDDIKKRVKGYLELKDDNKCFIIEDKKGNMVGHIHTYECNKRNGTFFYGVEIKEEFWRNGYGTEAIKILLNFYFNYLRYNKVVSMVYGFNGPSLFLHNKLGFKREGQLCEMIYSDGKYHDLIYFGLTKKDFCEKYSIKLERDE